MKRMILPSINLYAIRLLLDKPDDIFFLDIEEAIPPGLRKHFLAALVLSGLAILVTPYGWRYPAHLITSLLGKSMGEFRVITAYQSTLDPQAGRFHYTTYLCLAGLILLGLMLPHLKRKRPDWAVILANLAFAFLYTRFLRTTYYWVPVFSLSAVHLLAQRENWLWPKGRVTALVLGAVIALSCLLLGGRAGFDAVCKPYDPRWFGFGISYQNPVEEADFVKTHLSAYRLGNDYSSGGYLLWALWPEMKVMIDPRQFPFKGWLDRYGAFHSGRSVGEFVREVRCEVWCIRYECRPLISWFLHSPDWRVAFYGPSAVVFVSKEVAGGEGKPLAGKGIESIKNIDQAIRVLGFAASLHDWNNARLVSKAMKEQFKCPNQKEKTQGAADWLGRRIKSFYQGDRGVTLYRHTE